MRIYENARNEIFRERADKSRNVVRINRSVKRYYGNVKVARYICIGRFLRLQLEKPIKLRLLRLRYQYFHRSHDTFGILSTVAHYIGRMLYIPHRGFLFMDTANISHRGRFRTIKSHAKARSSTPIGQLLAVIKRQ